MPDYKTPNKTRQIFRLVGKHKDDAKPIFIATFDNKEEAERAAQTATNEHRDGKWAFYVEAFLGRVKTEMKLDSQWEA